MYKYDDAVGVWGLSMSMMKMYNFNDDDIWV